MSIESYITFVLASTLILIIPGPTIILVISQAVAHGRNSVIPLVLGVLMGDFTAMTLSVLGLGALMSASALLFSLFKWVGALYLLYLGFKMWRANPAEAVFKQNSRLESAMSLFRKSYIVTALNPKSIAFIVAFLPQFINPAQANGLQFVILGGTFLFLATLNAALYAIFAGELRNHIRKTKVRRIFNRCGGGALIGAGILTAGIQHSS